MEPTAALPELLYIQDPLCGWCYGMSPVISQVQQDFAGRRRRIGAVRRHGDTATRPAPIAETWD